MTVRDIRVFGDPVLRTVCDPVVPGDPKTLALVRDLIDTVQLPGRAGVAANQIGVGLRAFSYNVDGRIGAICNPELVATDGELEMMSEGCLSVPGLSFDTPRYPWAKVRGITAEGEEIELEGEDLFAEMLQHECQHLDGILYIMTLEKETRRRAMHAVRESDWY
ncbi:peptide deformylase [Humidisolicoccus flavus]|uniref:peptide deformylase n=1 Tax=Humidisolicoccus flavus TaxID=3111414 RepID=UPI003247FCA6